MEHKVLPKEVLRVSWDSFITDAKVKDAARYIQRIKNDECNNELRVDTRGILNSKSYSLLLAYLFLGYKEFPCIVLGDHEKQKIYKGCTRIWRLEPILKDKFNELDKIFHYDDT